MLHRWYRDGSFNHLPITIWKCLRFSKQFPMRTFQRDGTVKSLKTPLPQIWTHMWCRCFCELWDNMTFLLEKLQCYGFRPPNWMESYLVNRSQILLWWNTQIVCMWSSFKWFTLAYLFHFYILHSKNAKITMYADDTTLYESEATPADVATILSRELLENWSMKTNWFLRV